MDQNDELGGVEVFKFDQRKIDVLNSEQFYSALLARVKDGARLVLDLSNVQFIDSSGLGKIVSALRAFREKRGEMRLCGAQPPVLVLFNMVRLGEIVGIDTDAASAAAALGKPAEP